MKVLITGAFGFVGTNLSAYLAAKGHELWALDVASVGNQQSAIGNGQWAIGNEDGSRQDTKAQRGCYSRRFNWAELERIPWNEVDAVVHLAGKAHDTRNAGDPQSYFDINVGLTKKVLSSLVHDCDSALVGKQEASGNGQWAIGKENNDSRQDAKAQRDGLTSRTEWQNGAGVAALAKRATPANLLAMPKRFVLFSSVKAVADRVEGVLTEAAVPNPQTAYGQSKLEAEKTVLKVGEVGSTAPVGAGSKRFNEFSGPAAFEPLNQAEGRLNPVEPLSQAEGRLNTFILRPCMIHGPGNKGNLNLLYGVVRKGVPWPLGAFENRRSMASIDNVCAVVEGLLTKDVPAGVYQVADDETLSTNDLIGLMARSLGKRPRIWRVPAGLIRWAARCGDLLRLPLNSERLKKLTESYVASNAKIKEALGWEAMPVRAEEGMRKTLESFNNKQ